MYSFPSSAGFLFLFFSLAGAALGAEPAAAGGKKLETYLMLPEPLVMRSSISKAPKGAKRTVFTPAKEAPDGGEVKTYSTQEFEKLGIGWESFLEKAQKSADRRLREVKPDLIENGSHAVIYAVYRGADPSITCLLVAPSLSTLFEKLFGETLWLVTPDRHSLFVFPAKSPALADFAADLKERFDRDAHATSEEVFELTKQGGLHAIGNYTGRSDASDSNAGSSR